MGNGDGDFAWGGGHFMQCIYDVLLNCTLEICNPINSTKKKERKRGAQEHHGTRHVNEVAVLEMGPPAQTPIPAAPPPAPAPADT